MGLRDKIQAKVGAAFDKSLADAVESFTGSRTIQGGYDPATGTTTTTTETYTGRGVFGGYSVQEIDGQHIRATDVRLTALQNEVTDAPKVGDTLAGLRVLNVGKDPADASYTVQLRKA